ncbi:hypothetical protein JZ751_021367 [Albula glossodonta]|uniref:Uncharacterized protein n=1 Tax=Albula glossodonta TaxID=121402 RepID=A0A8T2NJG2_9TELE|nr:hypothetical protein JZ751_021367 [Albula glossodonta]
MRPKSNPDAISAGCGSKAHGAAPGVSFRKEFYSVQLSALDCDSFGRQRNNALRTLSLLTDTGSMGELHATQKIKRIGLRGTERGGVQWQYRGQLLASRALERVPMPALYHNVINKVTGGEETTLPQTPPSLPLLLKLVTGPFNGKSHTANPPLINRTLQV